MKTKPTKEQAFREMLQALQIARTQYRRFRNRGCHLYHTWNIIDDAIRMAEESN